MTDKEVQEFLTRSVTNAASAVFADDCGDISESTYDSESGEYTIRVWLLNQALTAKKLRETNKLIKADIKTLRVVHSSMLMPNEPEQFFTAYIYILGTPRI